MILDKIGSAMTCATLALSAPLLAQVASSGGIELPIGGFEKSFAIGVVLLLIWLNRDQRLSSEARITAIYESKIKEIATINESKSKEQKDYEALSATVLESERQITGAALESERAGRAQVYADMMTLIRENMALLREKAATNG